MIVIYICLCTYVFVVLYIQTNESKILRVFLRSPRDSSLRFDEEVLFLVEVFHPQELEQISRPKSPWTLQWRGLNLYSRGLGPQNSHC